MLTRRDFVAASLAGTRAGAAGTVYPNRWVWLPNGLTKDSDVPSVESIAKTASAHGLTALVLNPGFDSITVKPPEFTHRLREVKRLCDALNLELTPAVFSPGYGGGVLVQDQNLAAGFPVRDALFIADGDHAAHVPDPPVSIANGLMVRFTGHRLAMFDLQDGPGEISFVDQTVTHGAGPSLRFEGFGERAPRGRARLMQSVRVQPYRHYRLSLWAKTDGLGRNELIAQALGPKDRRLSNNSTPNSGWDDWREVSIEFNSLDNEIVRLYAGVWWAMKGRFWLADWRLEELGPVNVLRRPGAPVRVRLESGGELSPREYELLDPKLNSRLNHEGPDLRISKRKIAKGTRLRVSWYYGMGISSDQVCLCLSEPKVFEIWRAQARRIHELIGPKRYLMSMDEWRVGGWCEACQKRGVSTGQIFGEAIARGFSILREVNPSADVWCWSDMLDPNHNAHDLYYLLAGDLTGSWNYIPKDLGIMCWLLEIRDKSLRHFSSLGFRTMAGAYYDRGDLVGTRQWMQSLAQTPKAEGIMYATFANDYKLLADFGDVVSKPG